MLITLLPRKKNKKKKKKIKKKKKKQLREIVCGGPRDLVSGA